MAERNDSWFSSWLTAAKNKSTEVLEFVKKDLEEFGSTIKHEASCVVSSTGSVLEKSLKLDSPDSTASTVKKSFSTFLGQVNTVLNPSPDDSDTEAVLVIEGNETVPVTKLQEAIYKLQVDENTFLADPESKYHQQYQCWLDILEDQLNESTLVKHLTSSVPLNNQYVNLVPEKVSHNLFWKRYLFKKAVIEDDLARQETLEKRKSKEKIKPANEENLKWDQEDFATDIELTEEEQIRLLEQYEMETKQRNLQKDAKKTDEEEGTLFESNSDLVIVDEKFEKSPDAKKSPTVPNRRVSDLKLSKTESCASLETASTSSSDGDWEKIEKQ